ncbi:CPBP family intramembrane glutamic endopeptidase [Quadrisphaera sp. KR29]|uniref:CPBP family intramembrane glutamic endopeptidase n=1 Tax=Quadrisphaera sp. KR29 TaxID=3461391 RepID=UPI004043EAF2
MGEVLLVAALSLGRSGVYAVVQLIALVTAAGGVAAGTATLNPSRSPRPYLDLTYQLLGIGFALVPVALCLFLLAGGTSGRGPLLPAVGRTCRRIGLDLRRPGRDLLQGVGLAAVIGIPGLGLYLAGRALGVTAEVQASALTGLWWTVPVLVASALQNALLEEVVVVAYLLDRLPRLRWARPALLGRLLPRLSPQAWTVAWVVAASSLLRASYHLYQGFGPGLGNLVMGVVFALVYWRTRRVMPLVVAHALLDVVAFVGYQYLAGPLGLS